MKRSSIWSALFSTSLISLPSHNIEQSWDSFRKMFLDSVCYFSFTHWLHWQARVLTKIFHGHFFSGKRKLPKQGILFEWWPQLLQRPFRVNFLWLAFLNSIRYGQFSLWHAKKLRQVAICRSLLKPLLLLSLNVFHLSLNKNDCRCWLVLQKINCRWYQTGASWFD